MPGSSGSARTAVRFRFGYDGLLRLRWIENPAGERYEREYDASGNIAWETTFAGVTTEYYEHDGANQITTLTRGGLPRSGSPATTRTGSLRRSSRPDGGAVPLTTGAGASCTRTFGGTSCQYERDPEGRVLREVQEASGWLCGGVPVRRARDARGAQVFHPDGAWGAYLRQPEDGQPSRLTLVGSDTGLVGRPRPRRHRRGAPVPRNSRTTRVDGRSSAGASTPPAASRRIEILRSAHARPRLLDAKGAERSARAASNGAGWARRRDHRCAARLPPLRPRRDGEAGRAEAASRCASGSPRAAGHRRAGRPCPSPSGAMGGLSRTASSLELDSAGRLAARHADDPLQSWQYRYDENNQLIRAVRGDGLEHPATVLIHVGRRLAVGFNDGTSVWFGWDGRQHRRGAPLGRAVAARVRGRWLHAAPSKAGPDGRLAARAHRRRGGAAALRGAGSSSAPRSRVSTWGGWRRGQEQPGASCASRGSAPMS